MSKNFWMFVVAFIMFAFAACGEDDLKKTGGERNYQISYDVEADESEMLVHNGYSQFIASFKVLVDTDYPGPVYLKSIVFRLANPYGDISNELAFYEAFDNFLIGRRGEPISVHRISAYEFMVSQPIRLTYGEPLVLDIFADVNTPKEYLSGIIKVMDVTFGDNYLAGIDYYHWESIFAPNLGESATAVDQLVDGDWAANWQFPTVRIENCTEFEVQLWDGSCVYDNCQTLPDVCGYYGQCQTDLQDGRLFCECDPGFTPASTLRLECIRDAQFDIEAKRGVIPVTANQSWQTLGEWYLYTNGVEDGNLISVMFNFRGAVSFFANFRVVLVSPDGAAMFFPNEPVNPSPYDIYNGIDRFRLFVNTGTNDPSVYRISKEQEGYRILLIGDVLGAGLGAEVEISIDSATILSSEIQSRDGYSLLFLGNHLLGESEQDSYLCPLTNPIARVVQ